MPDHQHYSDSGTTFPQSRHGFSSNAVNAGTAAGPIGFSRNQHPAVNQHQLSYQPDTAYPSYAHLGVQAPYPQPGNVGYAHQPSQMPAAPADRRYAQHYEVPSPRDQPQFQQPTYHETYLQYGYLGGNMQPAYATSRPPDVSAGYPQPGSSASAATGQQGYANGTYPQSGHMQYPPGVQSSGQVSAVADWPGAYSRDDAGSHAQSQQFGVTRNAGGRVEGSPSSRTAAHQQPTGTEEQHVWPADSSSRQAKNRDTSNIVSHRQTSQQNSPHIVKPAVLNPEAAGELLYLPSLAVSFFVVLPLVL